MPVSSTKSPTTSSPNSKDYNEPALTSRRSQQTHLTSSFDEIQARTSLPLISIVEAACERTKSLGFKSVALFGTRYTMEAPFYPKVFSRTDVKLVMPNKSEQDYIH